MRLSNIVILTCMLTFISDVYANVGKDSFDGLMKIINHQTIDKDLNLSFRDPEEFASNLQKLVEDELKIAVSFSIEKKVKFDQKMNIRCNGKSIKNLMEEFCRIANCHYYISNYGIVINLNRRPVFVLREISLNKTDYNKVDYVQNYFYHNGPNRQILIDLKNNIIKVYSTDAAWADGVITGILLHR